MEHQSFLRTFYYERLSRQEYLLTLTCGGFAKNCIKLKRFVRILAVALTPHVERPTFYPSSAPNAEFSLNFNRITRVKYTKNITSSTQTSHTAQTRSSANVKQINYVPSAGKTGCYNCSGRIVSHTREKGAPYSRVRKAYMMFKCLVFLNNSFTMAIFITTVVRAVCGERVFLPFSGFPPSALYGFTDIMPTKERLGSFVMVKTRRKGGRRAYSRRASSHKR